MYFLHVHVSANNVMLQLVKKNQKKKNMFIDSNLCLPISQQSFV